MSNARPKHTLSAGVRRQRLSAETVFCIDVLACDALPALPVRRHAVAYLPRPTATPGLPRIGARDGGVSIVVGCLAAAMCAAADDRDNVVVCLLPLSMRFGALRRRAAAARGAARRRREGAARDRFLAARGRAELAALAA